MGGRQQGLKWFGEGFDGFPKNLPDDSVEYSLRIIDSRLKDSEVRVQLRQVQATANAFTRKLLNGFIWQRQSFNLELAQHKGVSFLQGQTNFGDSIEDEWLIVYILRELSKLHPSVWIRVVDADGQFLLAEAANVLPKWLDPEIAEFRLWMNDGRLFIIPETDSLETSAGRKPSPRAIMLEEALLFIQEKRPNLMHSPSIEEEAFCRLQKYPKQISDSLHSSLITIPRKLAYILHRKAAYISPAVEAFYLRDPISLRPLKTYDTSKLIIPPEDLVTVSVKFTKVGYAQVKSQQFTPPIAWTSFFSAVHDLDRQDRIELGMKITSGFEMLLSDLQNVDNPLVREMKILLEDLATGEDHLPSDEEISGWENRHDADNWLDIDFTSFEKELAGKKVRGQSQPTGFGDKEVQENIRNMVTRFESFLNDDRAGVDGAEDPEDMNFDDEGSEASTSDDSDSDGEDKELSFDEDQFAKMMKEMMGMPGDIADADLQPNLNYTAEATRGKSGDKDDEEIDIHQIMQAMEAELEGAGAFRTESKLSFDEATRQTQSSEESRRCPGHDSPPMHISDSDNVGIDYNLAKNLLESFKSQNGTAGPGGNLMGLMGMRLPRDDEDDPHTLT